MSKGSRREVAFTGVGHDYPTPEERAALDAAARPCPFRAVLADPPRLTALRLAIQSYGPVTTQGVEQNILQRARMFDTYLNGETDNLG